MSLDISTMLYDMEPGKPGGIIMPTNINSDLNICTTMGTGLRSGFLSFI